MKKKAYQLLYHILSTCSNRFNNKLLIRCKLIIGSSLLLLNNGYAQSKQEQSSNASSPLQQDTIQAKDDHSQIFCYVTETMPEFPGGQGELLKYLKEEVSKYAPSDSWNKGRITVSFVVDSVGKICDPEVFRSLTIEQDSIAIQIIKNMPDWSPGKQRGKPVRVKYTVPITFKNFKKDKE